MNYLSLWIANFGVVPWFSFLFFLFLPIFLALRALLVLVCCVLEAIFCPFDKFKLMHLRTRLITSRACIVKVFLILCLGQSLPCASKELKVKEFFLAKGEQVDLKVFNLSSFSVGNKEVLKSKFYAAKSQLLIKGSSLGFSDLVVWDKNGKKLSYHFYVVSKKEQLNNFKLANDFKEIELQVRALAFQLLVSGSIKTRTDLKLFHLYLSKNKEKIVDMVELAPELRSEIIADIYFQLSPQADSLICSAVGARIECRYEGLDPNSPIVKNFKNKLSVAFIPNKNRYEGENFKVELKVLRTDNTHLTMLGLGLDSLSAKVESLLNGDERALISSNSAAFKDNDLESRIVTSPAILTSIDASGEIQMGAEIPVVNQNQYGSQSTSWKFAGLKLQTKLSALNTKLSLELKSELTHPVENLIKGSKSSTKFHPKLGIYTQAFQVRYRLSSTAKSQVPALGDIPILGALFSSRSNNESSQWLVGYVKITRVD